MRYPADKLAQRLDFLCLQQRCLGPLATRNFFPELTVRPLKVSRSLRHQSLQFGSGAALRLKVRTSLILSSSSALCGKYRGLKRDGLQRALEKAHVTQANDQLAPERGKLATFIVVGQYDKGLIGPRWLTAHPVLQNADIIAVERLLRHKHDFDDPLEILYHFLKSVADHGT